MRIEIVKSFTFEAAHSLEGFVEEGHKCARLHGHTYHCSVRISGSAEAVLARGWVVDFGRVAGAVRATLDHRFLNDVLHARGYEGPSTLEVLCAFVWDLLDGEAMQSVRMSPQAQHIRIEELSIREGEGGTARMYR